MQRAAAEKLDKIHFPATGHHAALPDHCSAGLSGPSAGLLAMSTSHNSPWTAEHGQLRNVEPAQIIQGEDSKGNTGVVSHGQACGVRAHAAQRPSKERWTTPRVHCGTQQPGATQRLTVTLLVPVTRASGERSAASLGGCVGALVTDLGLSHSGWQ